MNDKFKNKKIFILGMARSGYEAAKLLICLNNEVVINDKSDKQNKEHIEELKLLGVDVVLGDHPDNLFNQSFDYLIKNPGVPNSHPYVIKAEEWHIPVINEVELAYELFPKDVEIIGITGTNGKTTTTTLVHEILAKEKDNVHLMGNIGFPVSSFVSKIKSGDIVVMEVSVQQLCNFHNFKTNVSVLTNLYEAHLDFVGSYNNYINIKKKIFNHHTKNDYAVLNMENEDVMKITEDINSTKYYFSNQKENINGCYIRDNAIYYYEEKIIDLDKIKIKGMHNYENVMAAILVAKIYNISNETITEVLETFAGVEHRLEFVDKINNREIYNDSKATNIKSTQIALSSFNKPIVLLLGGLDRGHSFEGLKEYLDNVHVIISYGETKDRIKSFADSYRVPCEVVDNLKEATKKAYEVSNEGDIILLSPACASWDQFSDFEERGKKFKEYVEMLK